MKYDVSMGDEEKREMIYTRKQNIIMWVCNIQKRILYRIYKKHNI